MITQKAKADLLIQMEVCMKENGLKIREKEKEDLFLLTGQNIRETGKQTNKLARAVKTGQMGPTMMEITKMD